MRTKVFKRAIGQAFASFIEWFLIRLPLIDLLLQKIKKNGSEKYIHENFIYSNSFTFSKNRSYIKKSLKNFHVSNDEIINIIDSCYVIQVDHGNLGHFFHDQFFHLYRLWSIEQRKVLVFVRTSDSSATKIGVNDQVIVDFLSAVIGSKFIVHCDFARVYRCDKLVIPSEGRNLKLYRKYKDDILRIRQSCIDYFDLKGIKRNNFYIYPRLELQRKRCVNLDEDFLDERKIKIINLSEFSLRAQIEILLSSRLFISMVGASVFNLIFMDRNSSYIEINPHQENSWAIRFGLSKMCRFILFVSKNIRLSDTSIQGVELDADVYFDKSLMQVIDLELSKIN